MTVGKTLHLVFKKILELFSENSRKNLYKKENFKPEIKPMIEDLQDELCAKIRWELEGGKCSKIFKEIVGKYAKSNNILLYKLMI